MPFVLDSSVALSWILPDEQNPAAGAVADRLLADTALVPAIWPLEIANVLLVAVRRRRLDWSTARSALKHLHSLPIEIDASDSSHTFATADLAHRHQLSAYDAAYLELAQHRECPLATFDKQLSEAAKKVGITLLT